MSLPDQDELSLSIEILSCRDLLISDRNKSSDPYVKVTLGDKDLHKTKHILKTLNPVFGPDLNLQNQFTATINYGELKSKGGLTFEVKDWDRIGSNEVIGLLTVSPEKLMELAASASSGSSEATELRLQTPPKRKEPNAGFLTIRVVQHNAAGIGSSGSATTSISIHSGEVPPSPPPSLASSEEETTPPSTSKELLIEIVSCRDILAADKSSTSDPYVKIKLGGKDVHKTSHIEKTLNPAFSSAHKNAYIIKCPAKELYAKKGIELVVYHDKGALGFTNDDLGSVKISGAQLYNAPEDQDMELPLTPPKKKDGASAAAADAAGFITIRVREATLGDKDEIKAQNSFFNSAFSKIVKSPKQEIKKGVSGLKFVDMDEKIMLVEILSCRNLLVADKNGTSDPYVKAKMGSKDLHKTDHANKTLNPVFGEKQNNSFVLDCSISELFGANGIFIKVKDWDRGVGGNDDLGSLQITAESLYECQEQEYHLDSPPGKMEDAGYITIRTTEIGEDERDDLKKGILSFGKPPIPGVFGSKSKTRSGPSDLSLLVEVVSCLDLRAGVGLDLSADPYVKVLMGKEEVHKTEYVANNQSPIYSVATKSVFILDVMKEEFLDAKEGLTFKVFDWDPLKDDELGQVTVAAEELVKGDGERMILKLLSPEKSRRVPNPAAMLGSAVGAVGKVGGGAVGAVGKVGGSAFGAVGKGVGKVGDTAIGKGVGGAMSSIGKVGAKVTKPVSSVAKAGGGAMVSGVKASGNAVVSVGKAGGSAVSKFNPLASKKADDDFGVITIRCRPTTSYDKKFLKFAAEQKGDFLGCRQNMEFVFETKGGVTRLPGSKLSMKEKSGPDTGVEKFLLRPESDPERMAVTKYLSNESIQAEALKPSRQWLNMSSGNTGRLFVEVIGADGLPNMEKFHGKTDAFAILVFEDGYGRTDTIDDCLSPRWMPWSRRAFVFNIDHPSSDLRVGIFDYDKMWNHDLIGRVAVPVSQLNSNTEYVLTYNLYEDSVTPEREAKGTVTLRLRVEYGSAKQVVMSNLSPPTDQFINFRASQHLTLARQVVEGKTDMASYSIGTLAMHIAELTSYKYVTYYIVDAISSLLFWRGQVPILGIKIPVHSMIAFYAATTFVESPTLWFSYFWFGNAWLLLAIQSWRNTTPHAWNRITPFGRILMMMLLDKAASPEVIPANFQEKEAKDFEEHMEERIKKAEEDALRRYEENNKMWAEHQAETAELDQVGETDISTKKLSLPSPFKGTFYPIQQLLNTICFYLRIVRNIYLWDEPYYAALLTAGSIVIGIVFYILPWSFLLRWTGRIIAWTVFGPHMKLVDVFYYSKIKAATDEEEAKQLSEYYKSLKEDAQKNAQLARIRTEEAVKQKAVKQILFGAYVERVPVIKSERFIDLPLHSSYAKPYVPPTKDDAKIEYIGGQGLVGTMIPELRSIKNQKDEKAKKDAEEAAKTATPKQAAEAKIKRV